MVVRQKGCKVSLTCSAQIGSVIDGKNVELVDIGGRCVDYRLLVHSSESVLKIDSLN